MSHPELGQIIDGRQYRDATHIAIAPVVAAEFLEPGEHVGFCDGSTENVESSGDGEKIGIVDPFLRKGIQEGQKFWLLLYPNTITNLRHEWSHPAFPESLAVKVLSDFAGRIGCNYVDLVARLDLYANDSCGGDDFIQEGLNALQDEPLVVQMWDAYEMLRGTKLSRTLKSETYFRCAC